jgi:hypothetical protein
MPEDIFSGHLVVEQVDAEGWFRLRLTVQLPLKGLDLSGVLRLITNHPVLAIVESTPEVRPLLSAAVTRPQQYV